MERRWCERIPISAEAYVYQDGRYISVELRNVSLEGALVSVADGGGLKEGETRVELILEDGDKVSIPAEVTHQGDNKMGLAFRYQDQKDFKRIRDLWAGYSPGEMASE